MVGDSLKVVFCSTTSGCSPSSSNNYYYVQYPSTITSACVPNIGSGTCSDARGNDIQGTTAGTPIPLTGPAPQGDPTCVSPTGTVLSPAQSGGCWANNWNTIQQYYATNPGEQQCANQLGVTACLVYSPAGANLTVTTALNTLNQWCVKSCNPNNSTQVHAAIGPNYNCASCTSDVVQTSSKSWYLWRMIADLEFTISPNAVSTAQGSYFPITCVGNCVNCQTLFGVPIACPDNGYLRGYVQNRWIPEINKASKTTSTRVVFSLSVGTWTPAFNPSCVAGSYQNCFSGIIGSWIGGQGLQTAGCTTGFTCAGQANQQLPIYSCPTGPVDNSCPLSQGEPGNGGWLVNMAQLTNQTVQSVLASNAYQQIYSSVDLNNIGIAYSYSGDTLCSVGQLNTCISAPTSMYMNIPLVFDVIGSYQSFTYQYPGIPPPGGSGGATITGFVYDANKGILGNYSPIVNACVGVGQPCTGYGGQIQASTGSDGSFTLSNVPPGVYTFAASAQGYNPQSQINVKVGTGANTLPAFYLQSTIPPGQLCLIPPVPNPVPFQPPIYGGLCVPTVVVYGVLAVAGVLLIVAVLLTPGGQALAITGAGILATRNRKR